ncbi:MAG: 16S/23S rRNA (cytidine-2'-O)-methyltransferase, partial [Actinobacteria bacterium]|nr:16S/23S rRNA (cytidine-2'-O)-methyltransferase [Actinomycetota bacterium]
MTDAGPPTRLDRHLVDAGLARARAEARELIQAGAVQVAGARVTKPAYAVAAGESVVVAYPEPRWVGRGARKLDHALSVWEPRGLRVRDRRCLDVGASTGGFT